MVKKRRKKQKIVHSNRNKHINKETQKSHTAYEANNTNIVDYVYSLSKNKLFIGLILLLISIYLVTSIRSYIWNLKAIEYSYEKNYEKYLKNNIRQELLKNFVVQPPKEQLDALVEQQYQQMKKQMGNLFDQQLKQAVEVAKAQFRNDKNETYLLAIDPYFYYRRVRNLIEKGTICDEFRNGKCWDNHMIAPLGIPTRPQLHDYFSYYFYKFVKIFDHKHDLMGIMFFVPIFIMAIATLIAFLLGYGVTKSLLIGFLFSIFIGLNTSILSRTIGGFSDTDSYNIMFPLLVSIFAILGYKNKNDIVKSLIYLIFFSISLALFSYAWGGWWFILDVLLGALVLEFLYHLILYFILIKKNKESKLYSKTKPKASLIESKQILSTFIYIVLILIFAQLGLLFNHQSIINAILAGSRATKLKVATHSNLWPNVFTTVAELNFGSIKDIINAILNPRYLVALGFSNAFANFIVKLLMLFALTGMAYLLYSLILPFVKKKANLENMNLISEKSFMFFFFFVWFIVMSYATLKGIRFAMYVVTPYAFFVSYGFWIFIEFLKKKINNYWLKASVIVLLTVLIVLPSYASARFLALNSLPSMSDGWYNALTYIKDHSNKTAIINSWWDFGHWFKAIADRAVTFDGASQNTPMAHWIGKVLQTSNPKLALAILRMLDCHSNDAFNVLYKHFNDTEKTIKLLYKLLLMNKTEAVERLKSIGMNETIINQFVNYAYCQPPEDFFITSEDMVYKAGVWGHFGIWNFTKAKIWLKAKGLSFDKRKELLVNEFNMSLKDASKVAVDIENLLKQRDPERAANSWISDWPTYVGNKVYDCQKSNSTLICNLNFGFTIENQKIVLEKFVLENNTGKFYGVAYAGYQSKRFETKPKRIYLADEDKIIDYDSDMKIGVTVFKNKIVLADYRLVASVFTKLFYFEDGKWNDKQYFIKSYKDQAAGTGKVIVWKVNWTALDPSLK